MHETVRPNKCLNALKWLIDNSQLFRNEGITINEDWNITEEQKDWLDLNEEKESRAEENVEEFPEDTWTEDPNLIID